MHTHTHTQTQSTWWAAVQKKEVKTQSICFDRKSTEATYRRADVNQSHRNTSPQCTRTHTHTHVKNTQTLTLLTMKHRSHDKHSFKSHTSPFRRCKSRKHLNAIAHGKRAQRTHVNVLMGVCAERTRAHAINTDYRLIASFWEKEKKKNTKLSNSARAPRKARQVLLKRKEMGGRNALKARMFFLKLSEASSRQTLMMCLSVVSCKTTHFFDVN